MFVESKRESSFQGAAHRNIQIHRISVQTFLTILSAGDSSKDILDQYPSLESDDINTCLKFGADLMNRNYSIRQGYESR
ncbi:MAG: DUF433 domain-containing protein [Mariniphaga sp.]